MLSKTYSYGKQSISPEDIEAVVETLKSDYLTQGPAVGKFEKALSEKFGAGYVSAVSNGTAALHLAGLALKWEPGDIVITTPMTFVASANCIIYSGATPDFSEISPKTYNIDPDKLEEKILFYQSQNKKVKGVVAVDYAGQPCDWEGLRSLADKYGFQLVADCCHSLGAAINGDCGYAVRYADLAVMSFHPVKHITTGEGGAVLTNHPNLDNRVKLLRTHGITKNPEELVRNDGQWYYEMQELGFNYRITDFQCALGKTQLDRLDKFVARRREIAKFYDEAFSNDDRFVIPFVTGGINHAYHLYPLRIKFSKLNITKRSLFDKLKEKGIFGQVHYIPVHLQPYYQERYGFKTGDYPIAEQVYSEEISIPMYPLLDDEDLIFIVNVFKELAE